MTITMGTFTHRLRFGGPASSAAQRYVEIEGRGVFVVAESLVAALDVAPDALRTRSFVPYFSTDLAQLELSGRGGTRRLERGSWSGGRGSGFRFAAGSEGPVGRRVDGGRLDQVFVALGRMQADPFLDEAAAKAASSPVVTLTLTPREGPRAVIDVGGACPAKPGLVVAVVREPRFVGACVPEAVVPPLTRTADELRDDGVVGAALDEITELSLVRGDERLELVRSGTAFKLRKPAERDLELDRGNALLEGLLAAQGELLADGAESPALAKGAPIAATIRAVGGLDAKGAVIERLEEVAIAPLERGGFLATRKEDGGRLVLTEGAGLAFAPSDLVLREREIVNLRPIDVEAVRVEAGSDVQSITRSADAFVLDEPTGEGLEADAVFADELVGAIAGLRAERWITPKTTSQFGLDRPRVRVVAKVAAAAQGGARSIAIAIGARSDDGSYAAIEGVEGVFVAPRSLESFATRSLIRRALLPVPTTAIEEATFRAGDASITLRRDGTRLVEKGGDEALTQLTVAALERLMPLRAAHAGKVREPEGLNEPALTIVLKQRKTAALAPPPVTVVVGASTDEAEAPARYARRDDVDATFLVPQSAVTPVLEALARRR
jgi:hypothetical protein